jgi:hypothetical protein
MKKELQNTFSWSVSRDSTFKECPRKYYFSYYGYWHGWKKDAHQRTREIYVLKQLKTRAMWIGQTTHDCIARSLKNISRGVPILSVDEILRITRNLMRQDFRQSRGGSYWNNPKDFCGLFEHEYKVDVAKEEWREAADTVDRCLRTFYDSSTFAQLAALDAGAYLEVEELKPFTINETRTMIKLDCATREGDKIIVWDWKTGRRESDIGLSLQMACYGFYARQAYKTPLEKVITRRFDLYRNNVYEQTVNEPSLHEMLDYINGSVKDMLSLLADVARNVAEEERFQKVERPQVCLRCNFLKVCQPDI